MKARKCSRCLLASTCLALAAGGGCGSASLSSVSPASEDDPGRHQQALRDVREKARKDQEDERKAFGRSGRVHPNP